MPTKFVLCLLFISASIQVYANDLGKGIASVGLIQGFSNVCSEQYPELASRLISGSLNLELSLRAKIGDEMGEEGFNYFHELFPIAVQNGEDIALDMGNELHPNCLKIIDNLNSL